MQPTLLSPSLLENISGEYKFNCHKVMFGELYGEALKPIHCVNNRIHMKMQCYRNTGPMPEAYTLSVGHNDVHQILVYFGHVPSFVAIETSPRFAEVAGQRVGNEEVLVPGSSDPKKRYIILALSSAFKLETEASMELSHLMACIKPWAKVKILTLEAARKLITDATLDVAQKELCYNKRTKPDGLAETILVYQPTWMSGDIPVTSDDVASLAAGTYLNDIIINFYLKYVYDNILTPTQRQKTHIFNSYFYKRLMKKQGKKFSPDQMHEMVKKWTQNVDIFGKDFIVIPVNEHSHWYVVVISFSGKAFISKGLSEKEEDEKEDEVADFVKETKSFDVVCESISGGESTPPVTSVSNVSSSMFPTTLNTSATENMSDASIISNKTIFSNSMTEKHLDRTHCSYRSVTGDNGHLDGLSGSSVVCKTASIIPEKANHGRILSSPAKDKVHNACKQAFNADEFIQPCILVFDSSAGTTHSQVFTNLRHYLTQEWALKKTNGPPRVFDKSNMKGCYPKIPQQINDCDDGVFLLQYVESFFTCCIKSFMIPIHLETWFSLEYIHKKREHISDLIVRLAASTGKGKRHNKDDEYEMPKRNRFSLEV